MSIARREKGEGEKVELCRGQEVGNNMVRRVYES